MAVELVATMGLQGPAVSQKICCRRTLTLAELPMVPSFFPTPLRVGRILAMGKEGR